MTIIYELLDEIIGGIFPGIYFCTYFLMCACVILGSDVFALSSSNTLLIGVPFLAISYVLGHFSDEEIWRKLILLVLST